MAEEKVYRVVGQRKDGAVIGDQQVYGKYPKDAVKNFVRMVGGGTLASITVEESKGQKLTKTQLYCTVALVDGISSPKKALAYVADSPMTNWFA